MKAAGEQAGRAAKGAAPGGGPEVRAERLGEAAVVLHTPRARALWADLSARPLPGLREAVPALGTVTVLFDPLVTDAERIAAGAVARWPALAEQDAGATRTLVLPVRFDGPDLDGCAAQAGLSRAAFVDAVCACTLEVAFLGFTPGFAFLTGLPPGLQVPRLDAPRERVPAGSVALGGPWAGVYPRATPGGWRLIGQTDAAILDLSRPDPVLWRAGDQVRFRRA
jgi:KipI family sensor histidine kinase inhibitor